MNTFGNSNILKKLRRSVFALTAVMGLFLGGQVNAQVCGDGNVDNECNDIVHQYDTVLGLEASDGFGQGGIAYLFTDGSGNHWLGGAADEDDTAGSNAGAAIIWAVDDSGDIVSGSVKQYDTELSLDAGDLFGYGGIVYLFTDGSGNHWLGGAAFMDNTLGEESGAGIIWAVDDSGDIVSGSVKQYDTELSLGVGDLFGQGGIAYLFTDGSGNHWLGGAADEDDTAGNNAGTAIIWNASAFLDDPSLMGGGVPTSCYIEQCDDGAANDGTQQAQCDAISACNACGCEQKTFVCGETFTDTGGAGSDYANTESRSTQICPADVGDAVTLDFSSFGVEPHSTCDNDYMIIYNGDNNTAPVLGTFCGSTLPSGITSTAVSGCLFVEFVSDASVTYPGWEAAIQCNPAPTDAVCVTYPDIEYAQPASSDATGCVEGTYVDATDSGSQRIRTCDAPNGFEDATCTATKPYCGDSVCDLSEGETCNSCATDCGACQSGDCASFAATYSTQPGTGDATACAYGTYVNVDDTLLYWKWHCQGNDGVTQTSCYARKGLGTCGNGTLEIGEQCDDGNNVNHDACTNACTVARCGDGVVQAGVEECDRNIGCNTSCEWIEAACTIDPSTTTVLLGGQVTFDLTYPGTVAGPLVYACDNPSTCGDGYLDPDGVDNILGNSDDEQCDDGNTNDNDGCSSSCDFDVPPLPSYSNQCANGVQDGDETAVDCGGTTCQSCTTCYDGIQNGDETAVDCGGSSCAACPTCYDGIQNGSETSIDCGGSCGSC